MNEATAPKTHNTDIKSLLDRANNIENELDTLREDFKELMAEVKDAEIDVKAFKAALKEKRKPVDAAFKAKVNEYLCEAGQFQLFA